MPIMEWNKLFNTNIRIVDDQHRGLVEILNSLYDSKVDGGSDKKLGELLEKLVEYTKFHFKTEEDLFEKYDYPEIEKHKIEHKNLTDQVYKLFDDYNSGKAVVTNDVLEFLKSWLINHIIHTDKRFGSYLNSKGVY